MTLLEKTRSIIDRISEKSDTALLFYSAGKDSMVLLDLIYPKFKKVICVFMYFVKDLDHVNNYLNWARSKYPNIELIQVPHWNLTYILRGGMYCVPNPNIKLLKLIDVVDAMRLKHSTLYTFLGMKKADSMNRRLMLNTYDGYENKGLCYPLAEWTQKDILSYMKQKSLPQPVRYSKKASSGIGFNPECFLWMRENYPNDLERIYKAFPMSRRILFEHDNGIK